MSECIFPGCVATWHHWHGGFPGGYDNPDDPEGPPIEFEGDDPDPAAVRDYNGAALERRPARIQRQRTKGWRMPEGAVYVGRPSRWGNRWRVDEPLGRDLLWDAQTVVGLCRAELEHMDVPGDPPRLAPFLAPLRGKTLVCWCPLDKPCHADVLLELANR